MTDTTARGKAPAEERNLTVFRPAELCGIPYSTRKNAEKRKGRLTAGTR